MRKEEINKYKVAYIPDMEEEWMFLCIRNKKTGKLEIIFNFNGENFIGTEVFNEQYKVRDATQDDMDKALISKL